MTASVNSTVASQVSDPKATRECLMVDANLNVYQRDPMKTARYGTPLALVRDRFILAISGMTGRTTMTKSCEAYDT